MNRALHPRPGQFGPRARYRRHTRRARAAQRRARVLAIRAALRLGHAPSTVEVGTGGWLCSWVLVCRRRDGDLLRMLGVRRGR